uniref:Uncharacterized protein n=1 Tax=Steinernema glaseri TaxID=37863 RepID=A0A1I8ADD9_9BILA
MRPPPLIKHPWCISADSSALLGKHDNRQSPNPIDSLALQIHRSKHSSDGNVRSQFKRRAQGHGVHHVVPAFPGQNLIVISSSPLEVKYFALLLPHRADRQAQKFLTRAPACDVRPGKRVCADFPVNTAASGAALSINSFLSSFPELGLHDDQLIVRGYLLRYSVFIALCLQANDSLLFFAINTQRNDAIRHIPLQLNSAFVASPFPALEKGCLCQRKAED